MQATQQTRIRGGSPTEPTPSLYELALEYEQAAQLQKEAIAAVRARYNATRRKGDSRQTQQIYAQLQLHYAQRRELLQTSAYLRRYYRLSSNPPARWHEMAKQERSAQVA